MATPKPFIKEICEYIAENSTRFSFGSGDKNLKIGELERGKNGVFAIDSPAPEPDQQTPIEYFAIDFWSINAVSETAYQDLRNIFQLLHQAHHYDTSNWQIYFSHSLGSIEDNDRNIEGRKIYKLSVIFITRSLIS